MPDLLDAGLPAPVQGGFTTRRHGASAASWAAANLALHVQDDPGAVAANRLQLATALGVRVGALAFARQVHGNRVAVVGRSGPVPSGDAGHELPAVDALVTTEPGTVLVMLAADCLPVLLADPVARVVAAVHAGRQGLVQGVLPATVRVMAEHGAEPRRTVAVLGPAICGRCYELPAALADEVEQAVPGSRSTTATGTAATDLAGGASGQLAEAGVTVRRIGGCTLEQPALFYSYRRDGVTGRQAAVVRLPA